MRAAFGRCRLRRVQSSEDTVIRAITDDGAFRVIAVDTTATVRGAIAAQEPAPKARRTFAELITGAVMVRESMSPENRLQAILQGDDERSRMVADTYPDGTTRGLVQMPKGREEITVAQRGMLQIARTMHNGSIHQGVVAVPTGSTSLSAAFMSYMLESEQVVTMMAVGVHLVAGEVAAAGGYLVQLLPEVGEGPLMLMAERLKDFESIDPLLARGEATPEWLLAETLYGMPYTKVGERSVRFGCTCSPERLTASLATLPRADLEEMLAEKKVLEVQCDFCRRDYRVQPEHLKGLLAEN